MALPGARVIPNPGRGAGYVGSGVTFGPPKKKTTAPPKQAVPTGDFWNMPGGFYQDPEVPGMAVGDYTAPDVSWQKLNIAGYDPDWYALARSDPFAISGQGDYDQSMGNLLTGRQKAIRDAVIRAGFRIDPRGDVDEGTLQAAQANTQSTAAALQRQLGTGQADLAARLAARGIAYGGGYGAGNQKLTADYGAAETEARGKLADFISGREGEYASQADTLKGRLRDIQAAALARATADPRYQPRAAQQATYDPSSGLYAAPDGTWYDANGNQVGAPPPAWLQPQPEQAAPTYTPPAPVAQPRPQPKPKPAPEPDWMRALRLRSAALNARYR